MGSTDTVYAAQSRVFGIAGASTNGQHLCCSLIGERSDGFYDTSLGAGSSAIGSDYSDCKYLYGSAAGNISPK
jgi:hypothetical protein